MTNLTFDWQIEEFMVYCQSKQLRPKTIASYEQALRLFQRWCLDSRKIINVDDVSEAYLDLTDDDIGARYQRFSPMQKMQ